MKTIILLVSLGLLLNVNAFKYMGVNQAGADFGSALPGTYMVDYTFPRTSSIDYFVSNGMNIIRLPFLWERIQPQLNGAFDSAYFQHLDDTVQYVTVTKGVYILLDLHNYFLYRNAAIGQGVDISAFQSFWKQLAGIYKSNPKVIFGLMNEPHDVPYATVAQAMQAAINGIRASGATNAITVPGNDWTGAHSWMNSAPYMSAITDPLNNFMFEMHQYFDNNYSGNGACVSSFDPESIFGPATAWLRASGKTALLGEFGIESSSQCLNVLDKTMAYLTANSDVWVAWTWWAAGPWWGPYKFSLEQGTGDAQLAVLKKYMTTSSVPTPAPTTPVPAPTPTPVRPSTTGSVPIKVPSQPPSVPSQPNPPASATTGRVKTTIPSTGTASSTSSDGGSSIPPGSTSNCTSGNMKCLSGSTYSTCNWGVWGGAQKCVTGTYCSPRGQYIYCLAGSAPVSSSTSSGQSTNQPSTSTSSTSSSSTTDDSASPTPVAPNTSTSTTTTGSNVPTPSTCTLGQLRCTSTNQYQVCGQAATGTGFDWAAPQSCQAGLSCHAFGDRVYCY